VREMSLDEAREFLTTGTRTGKVAVVRKDGSPMVVPIWFGLEDDGTLVFTAWGESIKVRALRRDPRLSICVDTESPPYSYVRVDGTAELVDDPELTRAWATRMGRRYMGEDRAEEFGARNGIPGELVVRVTPTRIVGHADVAS
jgi:PPOX class probable F420-dependent enzyme